MTDIQAVLESNDALGDLFTKIMRNKSITVADVEATLENGKFDKKAIADLATFFMRTILLKKEERTAKVKGRKSAKLDNSAEAKAQRAAELVKEAGPEKVADLVEKSEKAKKALRKRIGV